MTDTGEYYRILGVAHDADTDDIKKAFRRLARACHPDVAGDDPAAASKFAQIREAYETLGDPDRRAKYDLRNKRLHERRNKSHIRSEWRPPGGWDGFAGHSRAGAARRARHQTSDITLDDLFTQGGPETADFGFGAKTHARTGGGGEAKGEASDVAINAEVPGRTARLGGTVTVRYTRRRRSSDGVNVYNYDELHDLRVPPKSCSGDLLRVERMGHFSTRANRYGDLVVRLDVLEETGPHHPRRDSHVQEEAGPKSASTGASAPTGGSVRIGVAEAILGGRVRVDTPGGAVQLSIPPGTSSGKLLRLQGKGEGGTDWLGRVEIIVPHNLDAESRELIRRFAELNPLDSTSD